MYLQAYKMDNIVFAGIQNIAGIIIYHTKYCIIIYHTIQYQKNERLWYNYVRFN